MAKQSAGILVFRRQPSVIEVLLVHPGGPFWAKKDTWSIPKGELEDGEDRLAAARREFEEEVGFAVPAGELMDLGEAKQSGKINYIWAVEGNPDIKRFKSNTFKMEWPPKSGQEQEFPENDRAAWIDLVTAKTKVYGYLTVYIDRLAEKLGTEVTEFAVAAKPASLPEQQSLL